MNTKRLVLATALGALLTLAVSDPVPARGLRTRVAANHRLFVPDGEGPFAVVIVIPGCAAHAFRSRLSSGAAAGERRPLTVRALQARRASQ